MRWCVRGAAATLQNIVRGLCVQDKNCSFRATMCQLCTYDKSNPASCMSGASISWLCRPFAALFSVDASVLFGLLIELPLLAFEVTPFRKYGDHDTLRVRDRPGLSELSPSQRQFAEAVISSSHPRKNLRIVVSPNGHTAIEEVLKVF